jgi:O-antigen ligase
LSASRPGSSGRVVTVAAAALVALAALSCRPLSANLALAVVLVAGAIAWRRGLLAGRPLARVLWPPLLAFAAASVLSVVFSRDPMTSVAGLPRLHVFLIVPLAAAFIDERWWPRLVAAVGAVTAVLAVWGIAQYASGQTDLLERIRGPMSHYMTYAGWLLVAVLVLATQFVLRPRWANAWLLVPVALGGVALLLSYTRNAWVGLAVGALLLAAVWRRRLLLAYPVLAVAVWLLAPRAVVDRMVSTFDLRQHANYDRVCMLVSGVQMIRDHPLTGVGLEMVQKLYPLYRRDDAPRWRVPHLHNNVVHIGAERGLLGLAAYLWLLGAFFSVTWRGLPRLSGEARAAVAAALVAFAGSTAAGLFEYNFFDLEIQILTLVLLGVGAGRVEAAA